MFLATGADIQYSMLYDFASKEYYILATNLIKKYYKNPEDYLTIRTFKGKELQGLHYKPLFDYIVKSNIKEAYTSDFFQVLNPDFVSTEDGTGIVHIAPTFGEEDFNAVAKLLGAKNALEWLFMPVNEYGEFDEQIYDYTGESVLNINKTIIERLKEERKLIKSENITHSYPHCRRCHTPLISKAMSSWFIKEQEMNAQTWKDAEKMNFVPESVKNRFVNGLQQAPDWNIARNRYRGSPLPIWQNVEDENDHFSVGTLEGIYQLSRSGSKNITKHILIRHAQTDYNLEKKFDILGKARCTETGRLQAEAIKDQLIGQNIHQDKDLVIVISPLERTWETILPFLKEVYSETELAESYKNYEEVKKQYEEVYHAGNLHSYVQDSQVQQHFEIGRNLFVDFRVTDTISPKAQDTVSDISLHLASIEEFCHHDETGETLKQKIERCKEYMYDLNKKYPTKTVITVSHGGSLASMKIAFRAFDYLKDGHKNTPNNAEFSVHYRDNARNTEVDLHKPYVDSYRFMKDGKTYKRIPEVMDCWFESGSMPFGQEHYVGQDEVKLDSSVCKLSLMRHGQSINNKKRAEGTLEGYDYRDDTNELSEKGKLQAKNNINKIEKEVKKADSVFYISLLSRAVQTIEPYFEKTFGWKLTQHPVYLETKKRFDEAMKHGTFRWQDFIEIEVEKNIYLDARVMERHIDSNDMEYIQRVNNHEPQRNEIEDRATNFLKGIKKHAGKQVIVATHRFFIFQCKRYFDGTNYQLHEDPTKTEVSIHNGELYNFYLDVGTGKPREEKNQTFTADFIAEGLDQTRGRFRSLHVLGHAIKGGNAMKNVVVNGMILAEDGKKMSKSLRNYPDPQQLIEKRGGDSFRLHVLSAPVVRAEPMRFSEKGTEQAFKDFTLPLQNVFNFFETYAKIDNWKSDGTEVYFSTPFTKEGEGDSNAELILRINPDLIIS
jgi:broad specificity phosphatase PhoE